MGTAADAEGATGACATTGAGAGTPVTGEATGLLGTAGAIVLAAGAVLGTGTRATSFAVPIPAEPGALDTEALVTPATLAGGGATTAGGRAITGPTGGLLTIAGGITAFV
jgi:hypothetical protein